jgi:hypothetical protein
MRSLAAVVLSIVLMSACSRPPSRAVSIEPSAGEHEPRGRRYEITGAGKETFLLDNRTGRVWWWYAAAWEEVTPEAISTRSDNSTSTSTSTNAFDDLIPKPSSEAASRELRRDGLLPK